MNSDNFSVTLEVVTLGLVQLLVTDSRLGVDKALEILYTSRLYEVLEDPATAFYHQSITALYEQLKAETVGLDVYEPATEENRHEIICFKVFCLQQYKNAHRLTGKEAYDLFKYYGVWEYLSAYYEVLYLLNNLNILADIDDFIAGKQY